MIFRKDAPTRYPVPQPQALPCAQRSIARAVSFYGPLPSRARATTCLQPAKADAASSSSVGSSHAPCWASTGSDRKRASGHANASHAAGERRDRDQGDHDLRGPMLAPNPAHDAA
jgi:hypothetical protein